MRKDEFLIVDKVIKQAITEALKDVRTEIEFMACRQYECKLTLDRQEVLEVLDKYIIGADKGEEE